eukprot:366112-Chlamydomonas_euryale.AAC.3
MSQADRRHATSDPSRGLLRVHVTIGRTTYEHAGFATAAVTLPAAVGMSRAQEPDEQPVKKRLRMEDEESAAAAGTAVRAASGGLMGRIYFKKERGRGRGFFGRP